MPCRERASSPLFTGGFDAAAAACGGDGDGGGPVLGDYYRALELGGDESSILDDEILMMTDAEKEAFAEMQSRLEEACLSQFYHHRCTSPCEDGAATEGVQDGDVDSLTDADGPQRGAGSARRIRVDRHQTVPSVPRTPRGSRPTPTGGRSLLVYPSARRSRERDTWYRAEQEEELTFHPQINATDVAPRYMQAATRRSREVNVENGAAEASNFRPVTSRLRSSSMSEHLSRYLYTPVHVRLSRAASASSRRKEQQRHHHQQIVEKPREYRREQKSGNERQVPDAFLQRLEETSRRREENLQRIALMHNTELTFRPKLAPGTRRRSIASAMAPQIRGEVTRSETLAQHVIDGSGDGVKGGRAHTASLHPSPRINNRSRNMKRSLKDLYLFELRRQLRLAQLRAEREATEGDTVSDRPAVSAGSRRLADILFGEDVTHETIQRYLHRHACKRAAALQMEYEARSREEEKQLTFHPEVHPAPSYVHDIAQELALNKTFAVKPSPPKPIFRFS
ncbi:hypothetical protein TraAM80_07663 [Trypanosoma rangeli]|uniref:Uncharacterized protein n=1 Tax=Trypanosoma rangeli TaxID=5698 RepID=A0A3R7K5N7_TRYRA|nr:uncharacterized protein TraAM80_07663 [Trypanosoma rangeli]RNF00338.1 hypothetical protein TraAM80_07663 [Trypanosoma rangeli]|eukprot:RNF00338.1 hypothetical protein TraAM80_07663 [Trypanosoma rangeli]